MAERPTDAWRALVEKHPESADLFPESLLKRTDEVLTGFETEVAAFADPADDDVFAAVERVVLALNAVNDEHDGAAYETDERERLCAYLDTTITEAGIDVPTLAASRGLGRYEITDEWRDW